MQRVIRLLLVSMGGGAVMLALAGPGAHAAPASAPGLPPAARPIAGGVEPIIATAGPVGDYLRGVHQRLHARWTENFVKVVGATYPATHSLNNMSRQTTVAMTIRWDGTIAEISVKKTSGSVEFDRAAIDVARKGAPYPLPTADVVSDDTYAHVDWTFARDHRACAADARLSRVDDPLDVSLPRLVTANKLGEALRRVAESSKGDEAGLDRFARLYLARTTPDPLLNVAASMALVDSGDKTQADRLRGALASSATVATAARGLHKMGIDVCDAVKPAFEAGTSLQRELAMAAARAAVAAGADISRCAAPLALLVADPKQPQAMRLCALDILVTHLPAAAPSVVTTAQQDKDPAVRGAALLASVRRGAGRPEMYRLAPLLHDKVVEIRGAASAGMVRAAGDMALDQLYLLARETDARPGQAVAAELGEMTTPASAAFLGRMLKKDNFAVQLAAAQALARRKDTAARGELQSVKDDARAPAEVRAIATRQAKGEPAKAPGEASAARNAATEPLRQMLSQNRNPEAGGWIIEKFASLEPRDAVEVLGAWLQRQPTAASADRAASRPAGAAAAAPAAQAPAPAPTQSSSSTSALAF